MNLFCFLLLKSFLSSWHSRVLYMKSSTQVYEDRLQGTFVRSGHHVGSQLAERHFIFYWLYGVLVYQSSIYENNVLFHSKCHTFLQVGSINPHIKDVIIKMLCFGETEDQQRNLNSDYLYFIKDWIIKSPLFICKNCNLRTHLDAFLIKSAWMQIIKAAKNEQDQL